MAETMKLGNEETRDRAYFRTNEKREMREGVFCYEDPDFSFGGFMRLSFFSASESSENECDRDRNDTIHKKKAVLCITDV